MDTSFSWRAVLGRAFPALQQPRFRSFWLGQAVSLIGTWMQNIGLAWLVIQLTDSPFLLGLATAVQFLPILAFSVVVGPFVDRFPKRKLLIFTQTSLMVLASLLALLTALGAAPYGVVLVFSFLLGCINTLDIPTRQSFVIELSGREHLLNAISLNSAAFNAARIVGPAVAGLLIGLLGTALCFLINALSFLAVLAALLKMPGDLRPAGDTLPLTSVRQVWTGMREGLKYVRLQPRLLLPLLLMGLLSTFVLNYNIFVPVFAQKQLGGGALQFGLLMAAMGLGSLVAALRLAVTSRKGPRLGLMAVGAVGMSIFLLLTGLQSDFKISALLLAVGGYFTITCSASANSWLQLQTQDGMRGRVMSLYALMVGGLTPFGSLYAGHAMDTWGPARAMVLSGAIGLVGTALIGILALKERKK